MASVLLNNVSNALWHAFTALSPSGDALVPKSRLKVLTANIGTLLEMYGVERGLDHFRSTPSLSFEHFRYYLQKEVFSSLPEALSLRELRACEARLDEVCWLVCRARLLRREGAVFSDECVYQLFRVFCLVAELAPADTPAQLQVVAHPSEVGAVGARLAASLGLDWEADDFDAVAAAVGAFRFPSFLALLEGRLAGAPAARDAAGLEEAVDELHQTFLLDVIKQGPLQKRGYLLPTLREYWFVLQPTELSYYKGRGGALCGCVALDPQCRVDAEPGDEPGPLSNGPSPAGSVSTLPAGASPPPPPPRPAHPQRLVITTRERVVELVAPDHRSRLQWASALRAAIGHSGARDGWQRQAAARRRVARHAEAARARDEASRRRSTLLDMEQTRAQLRAEKMAREAAECAARELAAVHAKEEARLKELEDVRARLERLLQEETQAKRDEEIVRSLQARVLAEEWEKREELELLQREQVALLAAERRKREEFERAHERREMALTAAQLRLEQLDEERRRLDTELRAAHHRAAASEASKEVLAAKLRVMAPQLRAGDRVRRAASFAPSTRARPAHAADAALGLVGVEPRRLGGSLRRPDARDRGRPPPCDADDGVAADVQQTSSSASKDGPDVVSSAEVEKLKDPSNGISSRAQSEGSADVPSETSSSSGCPDDSSEATENGEGQQCNAEQGEAQVCVQTLLTQKDGDMLEDMQKGAMPKSECGGRNGDAHADGNSNTSNASDASSMSSTSSASSYVSGDASADARALQ